MIREHAFNTAWWGERVGILDDSAFFSLSESDQDVALVRFAWVEFVAGLTPPPPISGLLRAGFTQVDTQIHFRINLGQIPDASSIESLAVEPATTHHFAISRDNVASFRHERFWHLPGASVGQLNARYVGWANNLIGAHPDWCLQLRDDAGVQGWFLAQPCREGLSLTLAMLNRDAHISGLWLYQAALHYYAAHGVRLGLASFSVTNSPVHNIYARLGARFLAPVGHWLWLPNHGGRPAGQDRHGIVAMTTSGLG